MCNVFCVASMWSVKLSNTKSLFFFFSSGTCTTWCCPTVFRARMCKNVEVCKVVLLVTCLSYLIVPWAAGFDILFVCPRNIFRIGWDHWWKVPRWVAKGSLVLHDYKAYQTGLPKGRAAAAVVEHHLNRIRTTWVKVVLASLCVFSPKTRFILPGNSLPLQSQKEESRPLLETAGAQINASRSQMPPCQSLSRARVAQQLRAAARLLSIAWVVARQMSYSKSLQRGTLFTVVCMCFRALC